MRHTLLPLPERIALRREYYIRDLIVLFFMLSLAILVGVASLFPAFMKAEIEKNQIKNTATTSIKDTKDSELKSIQSNMVKSMALLESLSEEKQPAKLSALVAGLISMRGDLKFSAISATKISSSTLAMTIQGLAPTRNSLLLFKKNFEVAMPGNKVDLPVSELAKSANIQFSIQLAEKLP